MTKLSGAIIIALIIVCCQSPAKRELEALASNPIKMPLDATIMVEGRDTIIADYFQSEYKMIVYFDSTRCGSCEVKTLNVWDKYIEYAKVFNGKLKFYFIFSTDKKRELAVSLIVSGLKYPVIIDDKKDFERINPHLPGATSYHTFLLNERDSVIMVGNPFFYPELEDKFYQITQNIHKIAEP